MDFESIDRFMSQGAVKASMNGTTFFISQADTATDIPDRAKSFRSFHEAARYADDANKEKAWGGRWVWEPCYYFTIFEGVVSK